jgi:hypothetical protein
MGLLSQGPKKTQQDETLTYQMSQIHMSFVKIQTSGAFWFKDNLSLVNNKYTFGQHQG